MNKQEFLNCLRDKLKNFPSDEIEKSIDYYSEMIDDRVEDGMNEEDVISLFGNIDDIADKIVHDLPLTTLVVRKAKEKKNNGKKNSVGMTILLWVGSPIWVPLMLAFVVVAVALYITMWACSFAFWTASVSIAVGVIAQIVASAVSFVRGSVFAGVSMIGAGMFLAGLSYFAFLGSYYFSKAIVLLTKFIVRKLKTKLLEGSK